MFNRTLIAERVKQIRDEEEKIKNKTTTDTGQKPDTIVVDPEFKSVTGQLAR